MSSFISIVFLLISLLLTSSCTESKKQEKGASKRRTKHVINQKKSITCDNDTIKLLSDTIELLRLMLPVNLINRDSLYCFCKYFPEDFHSFFKIYGYLDVYDSIAKIYIDRGDDPPSPKELNLSMPLHFKHYDHIGIGLKNCNKVMYELEFIKKLINLSINAKYGYDESAELLRVISYHYFRLQDEFEDYFKTIDQKQVACFYDYYYSDFYFSTENKIIPEQIKNSKIRLIAINKLKEVDSIYNNISH